MNEPAAPQLPAGAENISARGFNLHAGPFYRVAHDADGMGGRYAFVVLPKHLNSGGNIHGGLLMTFADVAMSRTARAAVGAESCNTVSLTADFVGPGKLGDLVEAAVRVTRRTRTLVFQSANISIGERVIMVITGLWKIG
jgi:acyl-coenzyme A thioesterase PaaI-like protein